MTGTHIKWDENSVKTLELTDLRTSFRISAETIKMDRVILLFVKKQQTKQMGDISDLCLLNVKHQRVFFLFFILSMGVEVG